MPNLTTVTLNKKYAFKEKKTIHTKSSSSSSPHSFLDITPALQQYFSFPLSFKHHYTHIHIHSLFHNNQTHFKSYLQQTQPLQQLALLNPPLMKRRTLLNPRVLRVVEAIYSIHK